MYKRREETKKNDIIIPRRSLTQTEIVEALTLIYYISFYIIFINNIISYYEVDVTLFCIRYWALELKFRPRRFKCASSMIRLALRPDQFYFLRLARSDVVEDRARWNEI